ncbi:MAG: hypothetical protein V9E82_04980 [Candidatus Nanopelagicales bacterium]
MRVGMTGSPEARRLLLLRLPTWQQVAPTALPNVPPACFQESLK